MATWFPKLLLEYPFLPVYLLTVILALWRYPRYFDTSMRYFPVLLMYTLITEVLGVLTLEFNDISIFLNELFRNYNWLIYNIYMLIFCCHFIVVFYLAIPNKIPRRILLGGAALLLLTGIINPNYQSFRYEIQLWMFLVGGSVLIAGSLLYLLHRRKRSGRLFSDRDLLSWVCLGISIFYLGFLPISVIRYYHSLHQILDSRSLIIVLQLLIFAMYGCFIAGFVRMRSLRVFLNQ